MILIDFLQMYAIESIKTTSMENVHTGVLDKNKEPYLRSKDKAKKIKWCIKINTIKYVEMQNKLEIYNPLCQTYSPTVV